MKPEDGYVGLSEDLARGAGLTPIAKIILDAQLFGFIEDDQECRGWLKAGIQDLYDKSAAAWEPFGGLPSRLPADLREKHSRLYDQAVASANASGWDPDHDLSNES